MDRRCAECAFYEMGVCRRRAPVVVVVTEYGGGGRPTRDQVETAWPSVHEYESCGEFAPATPPERRAPLLGVSGDGCAGCEAEARGSTPHRHSCGPAPKTKIAGGPLKKKDCARCGGSGRLFNEGGRVCPSCRGSGRVPAGGKDGRW